MPVWSPEVANEFITLAAGEGRELDQVQLQKLVYIAHGWCLATTGQPLTGDRPAAWDFGPVYRRLAEALSRCGMNPVTRRIGDQHASRQTSRLVPSRSDLDDLERDVIARVYQEYSAFNASQLSNLTRRGRAPWAQIFAQGQGRFRDIPHETIRAQFVEIAAKHRK